MRAAALVLLTGALVAACKPKTPPPAAPDLVFTLTWSGHADLDLSVVSPLDERVELLHPAANSGGTLDADCNARNDAMCDAPAERIHWPGARVPPGTFHAWVRLVNVHDATVPVAFTLTVTRGGVVLQRADGSLANVRTSWGPADVLVGPRRSRGAFDDRHDR
jgi:hypothetical protein